MPSTGYVSNTFVANEQPSTAKWNALWGNDSSFNSGVGFNDAILLTRHFQSGGIQSQANAGTAGGTMWWINLGGLKLLWGRSAAYTVLGAGNSYALTWTLPAFFSTIQFMAPGLDSLININGQITYISAYNTTTITQTVLNTTATGNAGGNEDLLVIGT